LDSLSTRFLLLAENIQKNYAEIEALTGVNLSLMQGEVHGLLGIDGAGKSTLIKILCGVDSAESGQIYINGQPVRINHPDIATKMGIGVVHQHVRLVPNMSITSNIMLGYAPKNYFIFLPKIDWKKVRQATQEALQLLEVDLDPDTLAQNLTFSQQQVVKIAKALAIKPRILLLDEPTYGLTEPQVNALFRAIRKLARNGTGILYATQRLDEIPRISDRVSVLKGGKILGTMQAGEINLRSVVELMVAETSEIMALREADHLRHEFVSLVSHELRTPLATIRGYTETVLSRKWSEEILQECLENISSGCDRLTELVDNLLDMSILDRGDLRMEKSMVWPAEIIRAELAAQWKQKSPTTRITLDFPANFPPVMADSKRIEQVLNNLIDNAIKYSTSGGLIQVYGSIETSNKTIIITVEDEGVGIPPEHQERVFERFYRVPNPAMSGIEGSGLGLAICKGIIEQHGGKIWVKSLLGQGTSFSFSIPYIEEGTLVTE
jgi:signal transduction histidine kinase